MRLCDSNPSFEVWMKEFGDRLRIRAASHHAKCTICVKHKLILKQLVRGPARNAQLGLYREHLRRQYRDRQTYWMFRSQSRHEVATTNKVKMVSMIVDGMDAAKHAYPKSEALMAKEFGSWARPKMQNTSILAHGHGVLIGLSPQNVPASGSRTMELLAHMMSRLAQPKPGQPPSLQVHWSSTFLHLEADNCCKELKHQTCLRMLATQIANHALLGAQISYLQSGHSHEDIDCFFSLTSSWLQRFQMLENISDFQSCLQEFLANKTVRVHEPHREVVVFDQFRDWLLGFEVPSLILF